MSVSDRLKRLISEDSTGAIEIQEKVEPLLRNPTLGGLREYPKTLFSILNEFECETQRLNACLELKKDHGCNNIIVVAILTAVLRKLEQNGYICTPEQVEDLHTFLMNCADGNNHHGKGKSLLAFLGCEDYYNDKIRDQLIEFARDSLEIPEEIIPSTFEEILGGVLDLVEDPCGGSTKVYWQWIEQLHWMIIHPDGIRAVTLVAIMPYVPHLSEGGRNLVKESVMSELKRENNSLIAADYRGDAKKKEIIGNFFRAVPQVNWNELVWNANLWQNRLPQRLCSTEGCIKHVQSGGVKGVKGKCGTCGGGRRCTEAECNKYVQYGGEADKCGEHGGGRRCTEAECNNLARYGGEADKCGQHGGGRRCTEAECNNLVQSGQKH